MLLLKTFNLTPRYDWGTRRIWLINPFKRFLSKLCHMVGGSSKVLPTEQNSPSPPVFLFPLLSQAKDDFYIFKCMGKRRLFRYWWKLHELQISVSINKTKCNHTIPFRIAYGCFQLQWHSWVIILKRPCGHQSLPLSPLLKKFTKIHTLLTNWLLTQQWAAKTFSC